MLKPWRRDKGRWSWRTHTKTRTNTHIVTQMPSDWKLLAGKLLTGNWFKKASSAPCLFSLPPHFLSFLTASTIKCFPAEIIRFPMLFYILEAEKPCKVWKRVQIPGPISPSLNTALLTRYCTQPITTEHWVDFTVHLDVFVYGRW